MDFSPTRPTRVVPRTELPRALLFGCGVTAGVLAAMVVQVILGARGLALALPLQDLMSGQPLELRNVAVWWGIAGTAFVVGAIVVAALSRSPLPWRRLRLLRWLLGAAIVFALAAVGHEAVHAVTGHGGAQVAASLAALIAAALTALFGAYFTVRR